jgi:hypothetical protein
MTFEEHDPEVNNPTEVESGLEQEVTAEEIVADFEAILQKLLVSSSISMKDLVVLRRTINNRQIPDESSLALFPEVAADIASLKNKANKLGEDNIPWSELKQAVATAQSKY